MKIDIKGCYEETRGLFYFARMCSKIRLHAQGKLPQDYHKMLGNGFDGRTCMYLSVPYEDMKAQVLSGKTDEALLDWCLASGRGLTDEQVLIYNSFMSKRGCLKLHNEWVEKIPNAQHIVTKNSGHGINFEEPELVIKTIRDVVNRAERTPGR